MKKSIKSFIKNRASYGKLIANRSLWQQRRLKLLAILYHHKLEKRRYKEREFLESPTISLVTPVYRPEKTIIKKTINSVLRQSYPHWELILSVAPPVDQELLHFINDIKSADKRIKVIMLTENFGIAGNTNHAIQHATGEFIGFLDHDDELASNALLEVVSTINHQPNVDVVYSDEAKISSTNRYSISPFYKSAFSIDFLRFCNYMCHFLVIRKSLGDQVGWLREGFEGAQDFDLILRCVENAHNVAHIPMILYHWRMTETSTASSPGNKPYATAAGIRALTDHLERIGYQWDVKQAAEPTTYIQRSIDNTNPPLTIIIPNHNHLLDLRQCIDSILNKTTYSNYRLLIIENNSTDKDLLQYYESLTIDRRIQIVAYNHEPFNYSALYNFAIEKAETELVLLLNNDTIVITPDWIDRMLEHAVRPEVAAVGAKLLYLDDRVQHGGVILGIAKIAGHAHKHHPSQTLGYYQRLSAIQNLSAVTGACFLTKKSVFQKVGGLNPELALSFNDVDLCLRYRKAGYLIVWTPHAMLYHHESKTRGYPTSKVEIAQFEQEGNLFKSIWHDELAQGDPYYSPWLTVEREDFSLAGKPRDLHPRIMPGLKYQLPKN